MVYNVGLRKVTGTLCEIPTGTFWAGKWWIAGSRGEQERYNQPLFYRERGGEGEGVVRSILISQHHRVSCSTIEGRDSAIKRELSYLSHSKQYFLETCVLLLVKMNIQRHLFGTIVVQNQISRYVHLLTRIMCVHEPCTINVLVPTMRVLAEQQGSADKAPPTKSGLWTFEHYWISFVGLSCWHKNNSGLFPWYIWLLTHLKANDSWK